MQLNGLLFNYSLVDILTELQKQLKAQGIPLLQITRDMSNDVMIQCPYHSNGQERRPSAGISKSDGMFHCFACGEVHSLHEVISHCFGYEDYGKYGWIWLLKNFATVQVEDRPDLNLDMSRGKEKKDPTYVSEEELEKYRYIHPYMYKRRLTDEIIEKFDVGYDRDSDSITFPVRDLTGNTLFIARRSVQTKRFNYPAGVEKPVYGLFELQKDPSDEVIICESIIDALTCWVYGKKAVALNGLGTDRQFFDLRRFSCRKYIIATDMDPAGLKSRIRIKNELSKEKIVTEYLWDLNTAKDINDMDQDYFNNLKEYY